MGGGARELWEVCSSGLAPAARELRVGWLAGDLLGAEGFDGGQRAGLLNFRDGAGGDAGEGDGEPHGGHAGEGTQGDFRAVLQFMCSI